MENRKPAVIPQRTKGMYGTEENAKTEEDHDCYTVICSDALLSDESIMSSNSPIKTCTEDD